jgi:peptidoglycan/LPS O-acetylase OafA/YrhL
MHTAFRPLTLVREYRPWAWVQAGRLSSVQILRAIAALSVALGHALYEAESFDVSRVYRSILDTQHWTAGVDLFFVLSGFIMMWTFGRRFGEPHAWREFLKRRLLRIVPPYWIFTAAAVVAALLFAGRLETTVFAVDHAILSFLFIPHIAPLGGIHPILSLGWTLMYEMFFYLAFAAALCFRRLVGLLALAGLFFFVFALARFTGLLPEALRLFWGDAVLFEFLFGIGFYFAQSEGELPVDRLGWVLLFCLGAGVAAYAVGWWSASRLFYFGLPALALFAVFFHLLPQVNARFGLMLVLLGEASYTLYLSHPFVLEVAKVPIERLPLTPESRIVLYLVVGMAAVTLFSVAFYSLLERQLTQWLTRRARRKAPIVP